MIELTLGELVTATTPQAVVAGSLYRIDAADMEWWRCRKQLLPLAVPGVDAQPGNAAAEAVRCIESRAILRTDYMLAVSEGHESAAKTAGAHMMELEAEARCRIKEVRW
ncbi:MAG: hypothetical protein WC683_10085 [bacterium]